MDRIYYLMLRRRTLRSLRGLRMIFTMSNHGMTKETQISLVYHLQEFLAELRGSYYDNSLKHKTPSSWSKEKADAYEDKADAYIDEFLRDLRGSYYDNSPKYKTPSSWAEDRDGLLFHDWMAFLIQRHGPGVFSHLPGHGKTDIVRAAARQVMEDASEMEDQNDPNEHIMRAIRTIGRR